MGVKYLFGTLSILAALTIGARAETILFVGNSFTFGEYATTKHYRAGEVHDLNPPDENGQTIGGVPAIFKTFTREAGLSYDVSLETEGGWGLDSHYQNRLQALDRRWGVVVLQSYSTLDQDRPGNPELLTEYTRKFDAMLHARNPSVKIYLDATWSRADLTRCDLRGSDLSSLDPLEVQLNGAIIDWNQAVVVAANLGLDVR